MAITKKSLARLSVDSGDILTQLKSEKAAKEAAKALSEYKYGTSKEAGLPTQEGEIKPETQAAVDSANSAVNDSQFSDDRTAYWKEYQKQRETGTGTLPMDLAEAAADFSKQEEDARSRAMAPARQGENPFKPDMTQYADAAQKSKEQAQAKAKSNQTRLNYLLAGGATQEGKDIQKANKNTVDDLPMTQSRAQGDKNLADTRSAAEPVLKAADSERSSNDRLFQSIQGMTQEQYQDYLDRMMKERSAKASGSGGGKNMYPSALSALKAADSLSLGLTGDGTPTDRDLHAKYTKAVNMYNDIRPEDRLPTLSYDTLQKMSEPEKKALVERAIRRLKAMAGGSD